MRRAPLDSACLEYLELELHLTSRFHAFLWASGGLFSDYYIHQIDECCWMKDAWPVKAHSTGGCHYRGNSVDQNLDTYSVEYTFPDGIKLFFTGREITYEQMLECKHEFAHDVDELTEDSPAPLRTGADGKYPVPQPGITKDREY